MEALLQFGHRALCLRTTSSRHLFALKKSVSSVAAPPVNSPDSYHDLPVHSLPNPQPSSIDPSSSTISPVARFKDAKPFSHYLTDNFSRQHTYLRISVTERCNLRCTYCMPAEGVPLSPSAHSLTTPEIVYLSELFVKEGVTKIRLTGGEPTVRKDILPLMHEIGFLRSKGLKELCLTTNGISLHRKLEAMVEAGLTGVNLSLDTLDPYQFQIITRRKGFDAVIKSLDRILDMNRLGAGIKLKLNVVVMRGVNEREIVPFVEMGRDNDIEVRFIEYMPFDGNKWSEQKMLSYKEMVEIIRQKYPGLCKVREEGKNETSKTWHVPGFRGKVGFITSMTENFCGSCNRLRITSDGNLKVCLFGNSEVSLRDLLRKENHGEPIEWAAMEAMKQIEMDRQQAPAGSTELLGYGEQERGLLDVIGMAVKRKKERHAGMGQLENMKNRPMILIDNEGPHPSKPNASELPNPTFTPNRNRRPLAMPLHRSGSQSVLALSSSFLPPQDLYRPHPSVASFHSSGGPLRKDKRTKMAEKREKARKAKALLAEQGLPNIHNQKKIVPSTPSAPQPSIQIYRVLSSSSSSTTTTEPQSSSPRQSPPTPLSMPTPSEPPSSSPSQSSSPPSPPTPPTSNPDHLPHLTPSSEVHQISITRKIPTPREAMAVGTVRFSSPRPGPLIQNHAMEKGDVLAVARVAGIMAVKNTSSIIPLAHNCVAVEGCVVDVHVVGPPTALTPQLSETSEDTAPTTINHLSTWLTTPLPPHGGIKIRVRTESSGKTGVEMEALTGVMGAAMTVVDMCKGVDKGCTIEGVRVVGKKGGKSGAWGVLAEANEGDGGTVGEKEKESWGKERGREYGVEEGREMTGEGGGIEKWARTRGIKQRERGSGFWGRERRESGVDGKTIFSPPKVEIDKKYYPARGHGRESGSSES